MPGIFYSSSRLCFLSFFGCLWDDLIYSNCYAKHLDPPVASVPEFQVSEIVQLNRSLHFPFPFCINLFPF